MEQDLYILRTYEDSKDLDHPLHGISLDELMEFVLGLEEYEAERYNPHSNEGNLPDED